MMKERIHQPDYFLVFLIFLILIIGLIFLYSASSVISYKNFKDPFYYLKHQILCGLLPGLFFLIIFSFINYKSWQKIANFLLILSIIFLVAVFISSFSLSHQAKRWINLRFFSFQPVEFLKLSLILFLANFFAKKEKEIKNFSSTFLPFIFLLAIISFLIIKQPNFSGFLIIFLISSIIYFTAGGRLIYLFLVLVIVFLLVPLFINLFPYLKDRILVFLFHNLEPSGISYHLRQALIAIGSGGIFGTGIGLSRQKFFYLPEVFSDSIFAVIAEELGFVLTILIVSLYFLLIWRGLKIANLSPDLFSKLTAVGITAWFGFQSIINISAVLGIFPFTGVPLPLISYGGSAMVMNLASLGILINISKHL